MSSLIKLELTRALRNRKFLFFSVIYPSVLFLIIAGHADSTTKVPGSALTLPTYMMVSMASFGALTAVLMGNSERIAKEREGGWVRQLRLTTLPGRGYVLAKTDVVRHSGARRCAVELLHRQTLDGPMLELAVEDDGSGGPGDGHGNGLTGLTERLTKVGGTLEAGPLKHGFRLVVRVPSADPADVGSPA